MNDNKKLTGSTDLIHSPAKGAGPYKAKGAGPYKAKKDRKVR